ncbi:MAG: YnbE family lipoprotein [Desulfocapsa sp.]|nr:YnbE family lipoprotein [Desulfocapsa sp.]
MRYKIVLMVLATVVIATAGCSPTVQVAASDKPITINLNVKIQHEILVKVDRELDDVLSEESGLF